MNGKDFNAVIDVIVKDDKRYDRGAYYFIRDALDYAMSEANERSQKLARSQLPRRHLRGFELLEGMRDFALEQYGPMTLTLLQEWGIRRTDDVGEIVFNLIDYGVFGKTDEDSREDFHEVFDMEQVFTQPFLPKHLKAEDLMPSRQTRTPQQHPTL